MRMRFSTRLILSVVLIEAVMLSVLVWNSVRLISTSHAELLENSTREEILLLANNLAPGLMANDVAMIRDSLSLLKDTRLVYVTVYDHSRKIMASRGNHPATQDHDETYADAQTDGVFDVRQDIEVYGQRLGSLHAGYSIDSVRQLTATTRRQNTTIAAIELILSILATIFLGLILTRGLRRLEEGARTFGGGKLDHRIEIDSNNEIGDVARSFNQMADQLSKNQIALEQQNTTLVEQARQLQESEQYNRKLFEQSSIGLVLCRMDGGLVDVNPAFARIIGRTIEETLALSYWDITPETYAADEQQQLETLKKTGHYGPYEKEYIHKDGHLVPVRLHGSLLEKDGEVFIWSSVEDITERKRAETELAKYREHLEELVAARTQVLRNTQDELVRKERLAALGQLTATVSHELRNPLGAMRLSLYVIEKKSDKSDERIQKALERVDRNIDRCDHIVDELLDFTRTTELDRQSVRIDEWLESVIDEQDIPEDIQVEKDFSLKDVELAVDTSRLRRAVINVVENACHAMQEDGHPVNARNGSRLACETSGNERTYRDSNNR